MENAIAQAEDGEIIVLTNDVTLDEALTIEGDVTLDLNGKSITGAIAKADGAALLVNDGTLTITGGTIENTTVNGGAVINNTGTLTLEGVTVQGAPMDASGYPEFAVVTSGDLTIEEGTTILADRGALQLSGGAEVVINGGELIVSDAADGRNMTIQTVWAGDYGSVLTIYDGKFENNHSSTGGASVICPAGANINIYGGTFSYKGTSDYQGGVFQNYMGYGVALNVQGGTYNDDTVVRNVAEGYEAVDNGNGTWTVTATAAE